jgi:DNA polymerase III subunit gamma/tau
MTQALYNKWRPRKWEEVVGQQHIVQTLRNAVAAERVGHAYLFAGPRGTGKTTVARLLAKAVNCENPDPAKRPCNECEHCKAVNENNYIDLIEIDAASNTSVEDVRDLRDKINFIPNLGTHKIYIIDEVHMLSTAAFNALLKTLEEPPEHAIFILATTEIHKIPPTILSRCQRHEFRRMPVDEIVGQLKQITKTEKIKAEPQALTYIARQSVGSLRDAISLLDQMASTGKEVTLDLTQTVLGTATSQTVTALVDAILQKNSASGMDTLHKALDAGSDPRQLARQVVEYLRSLLLIQMGNSAQVDLASDIRLQAEIHAGAFSPPDVLRMINTFNDAAMEKRGDWQPSLPLELALAEVMEPAAESRVESTKTSSKPATKEPVPPDKKIANNEEIVPPKKGPATILYQRADPRVMQNEKSPDAKANQPAAVTTGDSDLAEIAKAWKQICLETKPDSPSLDALLRSGHPSQIKGNVLVVSLPSGILLEKAERPEVATFTKKAIKKVLGKELEVNFIVSGSSNTSTADIKPGGMVAAAMNKGGKIVDVQKKVEPKK